MTDSERIRKLTGMSRAAFSRKYNIPIRTLEDWDSGNNTPPQYVIELLERDVMRNLDLNVQALTPMIEGEEATILLNGVEYKRIVRFNKKVGLYVIINNRQYYEYEMR